MDLWQAILLGLVEGLTEYLPVSSTGHLLIAQRLLGIPESEAANAYAVVIQAGAIAAVLGLYRKRVAQALLGITGRDREGARLCVALGVAFVPAAVLGFTLDDHIERVLFGPWPIVLAWAGGGIYLLARGQRLKGRTGLDVVDIDWKIALIVGLAQCAALWPGVSRSLATIVGGLSAGLSLVAAVEFSFLLGLLTLGAATAYKATSSGAAILDAYGIPVVITGFAVAWLSAVAAVRWMIAWLGERGLGVFGWWRLAVAAIAAALVMTGKL